MLWNDPELGIKWPVAAEDAIVSAKDLQGKPFSDGGGLSVTATGVLRTAYCFSARTVSWARSCARCSRGQCELHALTRDKADFSRPEQLRGIVASLRPAVILNAAAYTAVDKAESEPELAALVNATSPGRARRGSRPLRRVARPLFDGLRLRWLQVEPVGRGRSNRAAERLRQHQAGGRAGDRRRWRIVSDLSHQLGLRAARQELSADDPATGQGARPVDDRRRPARSANIGPRNRARYPSGARKPAVWTVGSGRRPGQASIT